MDTPNIFSTSTHSSVRSGLVHMVNITTARVSSCALTMKVSFLLCDFASSGGYFAPCAVYFCVSFRCSFSASSALFQPITAESRVPCVSINASMYLRARCFSCRYIHAARLPALAASTLWKFWYFRPRAVLQLLHLLMILLLRMLL